jgi:hypothetical protein
MRQPGRVRTSERGGGLGDHLGRAGRRGGIRGHELAQLAAWGALGHHVQPLAVIISIEDPG